MRPETKTVLVTVALVALDVLGVYDRIVAPRQVFWMVDWTGLAEFTVTLLVAVFCYRRHPWLSAGCSGAFLIGLVFLAARLLD